jgi:hypothetical protein
MCKELKIPAVVQHKKYSKDWTTTGRIKVKMLNEDGTPVNPEVVTRKDFLRYCGTNIPKLTNRDVLLRNYTAVFVPKIVKRPQMRNPPKQRKQIIRRR